MSGDMADHLEQDMEFMEPYVAFPVPDGVDVRWWLDTLDEMADRFVDSAETAQRPWGIVYLRLARILRESAAAIREGLK